MKQEVLLSSWGISKLFSNSKLQFAQNVSFNMALWINLLMLLTYTQNWGDRKIHDDAPNDYGLDGSPLPYFADVLYGANLKIHMPYYCSPGEKCWNSEEMVMLCSLIQVR